jgi:hypothetical protein
LAFFAIADQPPLLLNPRYATWLQERIRWYAAYPLSYRHLEESMQERSVVVAHSSNNRWAIRLLPLLEKAFRICFMLSQPVFLFASGS